MKVHRFEQAKEAQQKEVVPVTHEFTTKSGNEFVKRGNKWYEVTYDREMNPYEKLVTDSKKKTYLSRNQKPYTQKQYTAFSRFDIMEIDDL